MAAQLGLSGAPILMPPVRIYPRLKPGPLADVIRARGKDVAAVVLFRRVLIVWDRQTVRPPRLPGER